MSLKAFHSNLRRQQLDRLFASATDLRQLLRPRAGWINEMRRALGMSAAQMARRLKVRQSTVAKLEKSEAEETISLQSLRKAAEVLDCTLVYAFVPRKSLESYVQTQAQRRAREIVERVDHTMSLEAQGRSLEEKAREIEELAAEMVRTMSRELWEETP